jgi:hypothetical protein
VHLARPYYYCLERDIAFGESCENYLRGWYCGFADRDHEYAAEVWQTIAKIGNAQPTCVTTDRARENLTHVDGIEGLLKDCPKHRAPRGVDIVLTNR